jgi:hypothetical protein
MTVISEYEISGRRYAGVAETAVEAPAMVHAVEDGWPAAAFAAGKERTARPLVPLLPAATGDAMVSGFMRTHRSKFDTEPRADEPFVAPNWFFKGFGSWLRVPDQPLVVPEQPVALIEEPEVMLVYVNDADGSPHYAGYTFGNDLCDIGLHRRNPGWNPYCKLCDTAIAPLLFLGAPPSVVYGETVIERAGETAWRGKFECGQEALYYRVNDMAEHLFGYPAMRRPGMVNYVLLGADEASFHQGFRIVDGDRIVINVLSHGVKLANEVRFGGPIGAQTASGGGE